MKIEAVTVDEPGARSRTNGDVNSWEVVAPIDVQEIDRSHEPANETPENIEEEEEGYTEGSVMLGAAAAGGCIGCLVGGPCLAFLCGAATAYGTTRTSSTAGDCARCLGHLALSCHAKALDVNSKYQIVDKTKDAAQVCWEKTKNINERHRILVRTQECIISGWEAVKDFNRTHRFTDRAFDSLGYAYSSMVERVIASGSAQPSETNPAAAVDHSASSENEDSGSSSRTCRGGAYMSVPTNDS